jgi:nucleotide-binding universal stress UspA family protein
VVSSLGFAFVPGAAGAAAEAVCRDARQLEEDLLKTGALAGVIHEVIVRQGDVWAELEDVIRQEQIELVVLGTHARRGLGKLLLGSVAEHIFREASCLVLTVGPGSLADSPVGSARPIRPFLFATDFSESSLAALPYAISAANHFGTRLVLLNVAPDVPVAGGNLLPTVGDFFPMREEFRVDTLRRLEELTSPQPQLALKPEFVVEFGSPSEKILQTSNTFKADAIILGLHRSDYLGTASHLPWATAYEVICGAGCSVLTVRN